MAADATTTPVPPVSRRISHNQRARSADVNPLLLTSPQPIISDDDNYIVARQTGGQLHLMVPGFKLPFKEKFFNRIDKYYEVDKRSYPFELKFTDMPSAQATFKFAVTVEFTLKVKDPCVIVKEILTSMLDCILLDLKRCIDDVTSRFLVQKSGEVRMSLQMALTSFNCPPFLQMVCGMVTVEPDAAARKMLSEIDAKELAVDVIGTRTEVKTAEGIGDKIAGNVVENLEEHQLQGHIPALVNKVLNR